METTILIMAAGIGSRFGTGIKQLEPVDASNHIIMDYSIHDAIEAGFNHVVFIIRKDIEKEFKEVIGDRIASICSAHNVTVDYAFQDISDIPGTLPEGRTKPWGTGQAVLAAKKVIKTPFIVINADDYYGKEGFKAVHEYLVNGGKSCMAGFVLKNTLSDNGGVTRGICKMDEENNLTGCGDQEYCKDCKRCRSGRRGCCCGFSGFHEHVGSDTGFPECSGGGLQGVLRDGSTGKSAESRVSDPDFHWRTAE